MAGSNMTRPMGFPVEEATPAPRPSRISLKGRTVTLEPLLASHADELFTHISGHERSWLWDYLPSAPPADIEHFRSLMAAHEKLEDPMFWTIRIPATNDPKSSSEGHRAIVGYISFLNIVPVHRTIEVGHVLFSPALQRTTAATETVYLLARYAFRDLGYRRLEWKCNNLNEPSKKAALRYGFTHEGMFRQHLIVKGRNRDTAWYSLLDHEWSEGTEAAFQQWLDPSNFNDQGQQKRKLEDFIHSTK